MRKPVRTSIDNFAYNLEFPDRFVSLLLQGKVVKAGQETGNFVVNTTAGGLGLFDVYGSRDDVRTGALRAFHRAVDRLRILEDVHRRDAGRAEIGNRIVLRIEALMRNRVDAHGLSGFDAQPRRPVGADVPPFQGFRCRAQERIRRVAGSRGACVRHHPPPFRSESARARLKTEAMGRFFGAVTARY